MFTNNKFNTIFMKLAVLSTTIVILVCITIGGLTTKITHKVLMESFATTNTKLLEQVNQSLQRFNDECTIKINEVAQKTILKKYLTKPPVTTSDKYKANYEITKFLKNLSATSENFDLSFMILGLNNEIYSSDGITVDLNTLKALPSTTLCFDHKKTMMYQYYDKGMTVGTKQEPVIVISKALYHYTSAVQYGTIYCIVPEKAISNYYDGIFSKGNTIALIDKESKIVSSSNKSLLGTIQKDITSVIDSNEEVEGNRVNGVYNQQKVTLIYDKIPFLNYTMVNIIEEEVVLKDITQIKAYINKICVVLILLTIIIVFIFSRQITQPLTKLVKIMKSFQQEGFNTSNELKGSYEVEILNQTFNQMQEQIDAYIKQLIMEERARRKAELNALQMQIHPHFLYNTLSSIKYLIYQNDRQKATDTINSLIHLLQNTLGEVNEIITIDEEVRNLKHYLVINKSRFGDKISVYFDIDLSCYDAKVPKLILQPIVENAFFHAFSGMDSGVINIFVRKRKANLVCEIMDNGKGMSEEKQEEMFGNKKKDKHFNSVGMRNIHERIKLLYGKNYGLSIVSKENCGTSVTLIMPFNY